MLYHALTWAHILAMAGLFGAVFLMQFGLPREVQESHQRLKPAYRISNLLLVVGMLVGFALFFISIKSAGETGEAVDGKVHMLVGIKMVIMLLAGAFLGIGGKNVKQGRYFTAGVLRLATLAALAIAAFLGVLVSS